MNTVEDRLAALEAQVAALSERLAAAPPPPPAPEGTFWALDGLKQRLPSDGSGAVLYTGTVRLAGKHYDWQYGRTVDDLLAADWEELPGTLSALAHPVRLRLLREILGGRQSTSELAEIEELGTTGQLHHHLRQITAAGWLRSAGRGRYEVPAERVVPLLAILTAAGR
ncbi:helix-turn-helix domain-containing protein [Micromonospora sp. NBC_00362]|uniref:ArsR/SmtB family transcription factor n=1 Tax=Micromonospora sp. NBC_00362 TaxID=2975975 RepID=UPI00225468A6|nr:helix-turn-helix domain-containing protein [Micromonospora sp. NBC_00362]MCX5117320.1 helix-turn-helix domain-containing protein [Micromonospora sp. NBC_00362]